MGPDSRPPSSHHEPGLHPVLRDGGPARSTISPTPKSLRRHRAINDNRRNHGPKIKIVTMSEAKDLAFVFSVVILSDAKDLRLFFSDVILSGARPQLSPAVYELNPREVEGPPVLNAPFQPEVSARRGIGRAAAEQDLKRCTSPSQREGLAQSANRFYLSGAINRSTAPMTALSKDTTATPVGEFCFVSRHCLVSGHDFSRAEKSGAQRLPCCRRPSLGSTARRFLVRWGAARVLGEPTFEDNGSVLGDTSSHNLTDSIN
jgi:hypothetical protein